MKQKPIHLNMAVFDNMQGATSGLAAVAQAEPETCGGRDCRERYPGTGAASKMWA